MRENPENKRFHFFVVTSGCFHAPDIDTFSDEARKSLSEQVKLVSGLIRVSQREEVLGPLVRINRGLRGRRQALPGDTDSREDAMATE